MSDQYSFSSQETPPASPSLYSALALDTGSPLVSIAVSIGGQVVAERTVEQRQSSSRLLQMIDECLRSAGLRLADIDLLVALRGPGSFTGLRIGLATLQGIRFALGTPTATFPTFQVLASLAPPEDGRQVKACVDALRGQWLTQEFESSPPYSSRTEPRVVAAESLLAQPSSHCVGFGISGLQDSFGSSSDFMLVEPGPLAPQALRIVSVCPPERNPELLADPLYLRPPAVTLPQPKPV